MSSKVKLGPKNGFGFGYAVSIHFPEYIIGQQMEIVEALGLPQKQEESVKALLKKVVWNILNSEYEVCSLDGDLFTKLMETKFRIEDEARKNKQPSHIIGVEDIK